MFWQTVREGWRPSHSDVHCASSVQVLQEAEQCWLAQPTVAKCMWPRRSWHQLWRSVHVELHRRGPRYETLQATGAFRECGHDAPPWDWRNPFEACAQAPYVNHLGHRICEHADVEIDCSVFAKWRVIDPDTIFTTHCNSCMMAARERGDLSKFYRAPAGSQFQRGRTPCQSTVGSCVS